MKLKIGDKVKCFVTRDNRRSEYKTDKYIIGEIVQEYNVRIFSNNYNQYVLIGINEDIVGWTNPFYKKEFNPKVHIINPNYISKLEYVKNTKSNINTYKRLYLLDDNLYIEKIEGNIMTEQFHEVKTISDVQFNILKLIEEANFFLEKFANNEIPINEENINQKKIYESRLTYLNTIIQWVEEIKEPVLPVPKPAR